MNTQPEIQVILVDENDSPIGVMEKIEAHRRGLLHRAVSVFLVANNGDWILQRRSLDKYHSKGLWTNTCCTHPLTGESNHDAARRRLAEEMGISCHLTEIFTFIYREKLDEEMTEYELDHVFIGITDIDPTINTDEVHEWKRISYKKLRNDILRSPGTYTVWFREIYERVYSFTRETGLKSGV